MVGVKIEDELDENKWLRITIWAAIFLVAFALAVCTIIKARHYFKTRLQRLRSSRYKEGD